MVPAKDRRWKVASTQKFHVKVTPVADDKRGFVLTQDDIDFSLESIDGDIDLEPDFEDTSFDYEYGSTSGTHGGVEFTGVDGDDVELVFDPGPASDTDLPEDTDVSAAITQALSDPDFKKLKFKTRHKFDREERSRGRSYSRTEDCTVKWTVASVNPRARTITLTIDGIE